MFCNTVPFNKCANVVISASGGCGHLLQDEVKHEYKAAEVHVVIFTVQVQSAVAGGVTQVFEGAAAERAAERAPEGAREGTEGVVLPAASRVRHHTHLGVKNTSLCAE